MKNHRPTNINWVERNFWFLFFIVYPLLCFTFLPDHDFEPKSVCLSLLLIPLVWRSWIRRNTFNTDRILQIIFIATSGFVIYAGISSNFAINEGEGISSWTSIAILFIFLYLLIKSEIINLEFIFDFVPYTVFLLAGVLLYQVINNIIEHGSLYVDNYLSSTLSNKNFLSESLLLLLPLTLSGIIFKKETRNKNIIATILILIIVILLHTISVWISLLLTSAIAIPIYLSVIKLKSGLNFFSSGKRMVIAASIASALVVIVFIGLNKVHALDTLKNKITLGWNYLNSDISTITETESESNINSVFERIFLWRSSINLGKEDPLFGAGLSNWKIMWPKYGVSGANFLSSGIMHYEHPHNEFFLFFSETGIIGASLFLSIFIIVFIFAIRIFRNTEDAINKKIIIILSAGVFSFLIISFFGYPFHRPFSASLLMLFMAIIINFRNKKSSSDKNIFNKITIVICLLLTLFHLNISAMRLKSDFYMQKAFTEQSKGRFERMLKQINLAENKYYVVDGTGTPLNWYKGFAYFYAGVSDSALYYFRKAELQNPYHIQILSDIGASLENAGKHKEAIEYLNRAIKIVPHYSQAHYNLAVAYFNLNRPYDALMEINQVNTIGEEYDKVLITILKSNAEIFASSIHSEKSLEKLRGFINDETSLIWMHRKAVEYNVPFMDILRDSSAVSK